MKIRPEFFYTPVLRGMFTHIQNKYRPPEEDVTSAPVAPHLDFLYFLMYAAMELVISTLRLFCPKYSTNSPSGPTRYMMMVWSTCRGRETEFRLVPVLLLTSDRKKTHNRVGGDSRCSRCLRLSDPGCNKPCRTWKPARSELLFPSGQSASGKTLQDKFCIR